MCTIRVKVTRADGVRLQFEIKNTNMRAANHHVGQVFPGHRDCQLIVISRSKAVA